MITNALKRSHKSNRKRKMVARFHLLTGLAVLSTLLGCAVGQSACAGPGDYDVTNLTKAEYWTFTTTGRCPFDVNSSASCSFKISFCKPMPEHDDCLGSSSCVSYYNDTQLQSMSLGKFVANPFAVNDEGFQATFAGGSMYSSCNLSSKIVFECDENALWIPRDGGSSDAPQPTSFSYNFVRCTYNLWFPYAGACKSSGSFLSASFLLISLSALLRAAYV